MRSLTATLPVRSDAGSQPSQCLQLTAKSKVQSYLDLYRDLEMDRPATGNWSSDPTSLTDEGRRPRTAGDHHDGTTLFDPRTDLDQIADTKSSVNVGSDLLTSGKMRWPQFQ